MRELGEFLPFCHCRQCGGRAPIKEGSGRLGVICESCGAGERVSLADVNAAHLDGRVAEFRATRGGSMKDPHAIPAVGELRDNLLAAARTDWKVIDRVRWWWQVERWRDSDA